MIEHGCGCTLLTAPAFLLACVSGGELKRICGYRGKTMFLDKVCINQVDTELQRQGISKLGAFLRNSSRMLVIYSDIYLTKLWTVYEVACFLSTHPASDIILMPIYLPIVVY